MPKIILLIGVPGSGKSTLAKKIVAKGFHYMNADSIREELYGKAIEQGNPEDVFKIFFERLEQAMTEKKSIIVDNTNCKVQHRKQILDRCAAFNYDDVQLWLLDVPLAICQERNRSRERAIPEDVIVNIYNELQKNGRPKRSEGKVTVLRPTPDGNDYLFFPQS